MEFASGAVDFSPDRAITPGKKPNYFPPKNFQPGAIGDKNYSPLVEIINAGGHIYNAPIVAYDVSAKELDKYCSQPANHKVTYDKVINICPNERVVTLELTASFSFARPVLYISTDANHLLAATLEGAVFAPGLKNIPTGGDDSLFSTVERIFIAVNGPTGK